MYNFFAWDLYPRLPRNTNLPPTIYSIMQSLVNYNKEEKTKIRNLAIESREQIFNFDYPLSSNILKEDFECMILNHFMMRRIGFDTVNLFQIQLSVKLNEIMPLYNKMFDAIENWDLFNSGENIARTLEDNKLTTIDDTTTNKVNNETSNNSETTTNSISDRRHSDLPQSMLTDIQNGSYVNDYNYDNDKNTGTDNSTGTATSDGTSNTKANHNEESNVKEIISRSPADKMSIYTKFIQEKENIYSLIFNDLESLFYQIVD